MYILIYIDLATCGHLSKFSPSYGPFENEKHAIQCLVKILIKQNILSHVTYLDIIDDRNNEEDERENDEDKGENDEEEKEEDEEEKDEEEYVKKFFLSNLEKEEDFQQYLFEHCNNFSDIQNYVELIGDDYKSSWDYKIINTDDLTLYED